VLPPSANSPPVDVANISLCDAGRFQTVIPAIDPRDPLSFGHVAQK